MIRKVIQNLVTLRILVIVNNSDIIGVNDAIAIVVAGFIWYTIPILVQGYCILTIKSLFNMIRDFDRKKVANLY